VELENLVLPSQTPPEFDSPDLVELAGRIIAARRLGHQVIFMMGGHVVKCGLAPVLIEMMKAGIITHLASNGSTTIHDFEIALNGSTSEDVAASLEDGSFGMAEETGAWMNQAIQWGVMDGLGMGEALGRMIAGNDEFRFKQHSLLCQAYMLRIPYTVHVAIGTDIIHQHPLCDFAAIGKASGQDFKIFIHSVTQMDGGVFCNFGSSVIGPEVFLKSLSIARNLGNPLGSITTANFDLVPLAGDYRLPANKDNPEYYYRPKKNIVIRPNSLGGRGYHITGDHRQTIPNLYQLIAVQLEGTGDFPQMGLPGKKATTSKPQPGQRKLPPGADDVFLGLVKQFPILKSCSDGLMSAYYLLVDCYRNGGTLFICGNGGSLADAMHISAELNKSFKLPRPLPDAIRERFQKTPEGRKLAGKLQQGLRSITLGLNPSLLSAVDNDSSERHMYFAQELYTLAKPGDVLLGISTSGRARNVRLAVLTAKSRGVKTIILTGSKASPLQKLADITILSPGKDTAEIQGWHVRIYHALCEMLEQAYFGERKDR
jgi:phosphoheptose isomerase